MNESNHAGTSWALRVGDDLRTRLSTLEEPAVLEERPTETTGSGLISLGYLGSAIRRATTLWCVLAIVGLILGVGYSVVRPPAHSASISILIVGEPGQLAADEIVTEQSLAKSLPVATAVVNQLNLPQTPASFASSYSVLATTTQVLTFVVKGTSDAQAVQIASALAAEFLKFRTQYEQNQANATHAQLNVQLAQAQQQSDAVQSKLAQVENEPTSPAQQTEYKKLQSQATAATNNLGQVQSYVSATWATTQTTTKSMVSGTQVLNPATAAKRSPTKSMVEYAVLGLIGGLAVGIIIAILGAVISDRLRRRDDIAYASGAPVGLSVGPLRERRLPDLPKAAARRRRDMARVIDYLARAVSVNPKGRASLAVVPVDDLATVVRVVVALAVSEAKQNTRVVVADLSQDAALARYLKVKGPGINRVSREGAEFVVAVSPKNGIAPVGPLARPAATAQPHEALASVCAQADLVLTIATLDPAVGGEHLATWATDVVAVVTAGRATGVRIHSVAEMIRLAGPRLDSVVLLGADTDDESLGATVPA